MLIFGAIGWPWLLRSLSGGSKAERAALLVRLKLPPDALPHLGSWKADAAFLNLIADQIFRLRPQIVVEFGVGVSTFVAAQALKLVGRGRLFSFDEHEDFVLLTRKRLADYGLEPELRPAPLTRTPHDWPGRWYDHGPLPERIDMLIVDGPHWAVHPFVRGAADRLFDRISLGGIVLLDDAARPGERVIAHRWKKRWPDFAFEFLDSGTKGTLIGRRTAAQQSMRD